MVLFCRVSRLLLGLLLLAACSTPARNNGPVDRGGFEYNRRVLSF